MDTNKLMAMGPCKEAKEWVKSQGDKTYEELWNACPRADWLLWVVTRAGVERKTIVLAAVSCVEILIPFVPPGENRPKLAIEVAKRWCRDEASLDEFETARESVRAYRREAYVAYADALSLALALALSDALALASALSDALDSAIASALSDALSDALASALSRERALSRDEAHKKIVEIVRLVIPWSEVAKAAKI